MLSTYSCLRRGSHLRSSLKSAHAARSFSSSSKTFSVDENYITPKSIIPTYHFQKSLPRLPVPKLEDSGKLYLEIVQPVLTPEQFTKTQAAVASFLSNDGPKLQQRLVERDSQNKGTSYISAPWYDMYLKGRYSVAINSNPFMIFNSFPAEKNTQLGRATSFIKSSLKFKRSLEEQVLEPEVFHLGKGFTSSLQKRLIALTPPSLSWYHAYFYNAYPLDMSQYSRLFATTRVPRPERDEIATYSGQKHIVVMRGPHFYVFDVLNASGSGKSAAEIQANLRYILEDPEGAKPGPAIGTLTAEERTTWANVRKELVQDPTNAASLEAIDKALFVVCLDDWTSSSAEFSSHQFLHGNGTNRQFDKSFSLLFSKDGQAAVNFEHSWGDGVAVLRYVNEIYRDALNSGLPGADAPLNTKPRKLEWKLSDSVKSAIDTATKKLKGTISSLEFKTGDFTAFGKDYLKSKKVSPDGTVQMAYQLAYNRMYGKTVATYESASTAGFLHGRTETIRPASNASVAFVEAFKNPSASASEREAKLRKAIDTHSAYAKKAALGQAVDRHFFALFDIAKQGGKIPEIFQDDAYRIINHNILSTSTLVSEAINGGGFGPVVADGYGIGYGVDPKGVGIRFNITSYGLKTEQFIGHISQSLLDIQKVLDGKPI